MVFSYCASKAALRNYLLSAREQIKAAGGHKINLVELYTPVVQSKSLALFIPIDATHLTCSTAELHDQQPGWGPNRPVGMTTKDFVTAAMEGFEAKLETVVVGGPQKAMWDEFEQKRNERTGPFWAMVKKGNPGVHEID